MGEATLLNERHNISRNIMRVAQHAIIFHRTKPFHIRKFVRAFFAYLGLHGRIHHAGRE